TSSGPARSPRACPLPPRDGRNRAWACWKTPRAWSPRAWTSPSEDGMGLPILRAPMIPALAVAVIPALLLPPLLLSLRNPALFAILPVLPLGYVYFRAVAQRKPG